jgi:hypothetical protein
MAEPEVGFAADAVARHQLIHVHHAVGALEQR